MSKLRTRVLSLILTIVMILSLLPVSEWSVNSDYVPEGYD